MLSSVIQYVSRIYLQAKRNILGRHLYPEFFLEGEIFEFVQYFIEHCFICRSLDSTVSEDGRIEPRTVATLALALDALTTQQDLIQNRLDLIHNRLDFIHNRL